MNIRSEYQKKKYPLEQALDLIYSNCAVVGGLYTAEPVLIYRNMHKIANRVENVRIWHCIMRENYPFFADPQYYNSFKACSSFYGAQTRGRDDDNRWLYPCNLRSMGSEIAKHETDLIYIGASTPMDEDGYFYVAPSLQYEYEPLTTAKTVILEVNPAIPKMLGDTKVHISDITCFVESNEELFKTTWPSISSTEQIIGQQVASLVRDGDTLQFGIGNMPNAVAVELKHKNDLGIHSEAFSSPMGELMKHGVVNNRKKNIHNGYAVAAFVWGDQNLYDFADHNESILIKPSPYVNDPFVIRQNNNMVSINTAIQVDLTGQVCSEAVGFKQYSGIGGALDFAEGAYLSDGGRGIIALPSTTKDGKISKITPFLDYGMPVTIPRVFTDYIVTEYGIAKIRGVDVKERARRLIQIAHPNFRNELECKFKELYKG